MNPTTINQPVRLTAQELARQLESGAIGVIDVREPMEFAGGHIAGSLNVPLARLADTQLPDGPLVLVCQSGNRSLQGCRRLLERQPSRLLLDLEGGIPAWQQAGLPLLRQANAPLPLMRQVQIAAGSLTRSCRMGPWCWSARAATAACRAAGGCWSASPAACCWISRAASPPGSRPVCPCCGRRTHHCR
jgi:rhodanese-related sulfurtransferase